MNPNTPVQPTQPIITPVQVPVEQPVSPSIPASSIQPKSSFSKWVIVAVVILFIIIVGGVGFFILNSKDKQNPKTSDVTVEKQVVSPTNAIAPSPTVGESKDLVDCKSDQACLYKAFTDCQKATYVSDQAFATLIGVAKWTINGLGKNGCNMTLVYLNNPNPNWVNKDLTCTFDNKIDFQTSTQNTMNNAINGGNTDCTGSLYLTMKSSVSNGTFPK